MNKLNILLSGLLLLCFQTMMSQDNSLVYLMKNNPYNTFYNPANPVSCNYYVGIPFLSNLDVTLNNDFSYSDVFTKHGDKLYFAPNNIYDMLSENNSLNIDINEELLGAGFRIHNTFLNISLSNRTDVGFNYPKELIGFVVNGNTAYTDEPLTIDNVSFNATNYMEFSVGIQQTFSEKLIVGVRPKLLFGLGNVRSDHFYASFTTTKDYDSISAQEDILINTSCLYDIFGEDNDLASVSSNMGFAIDLGATYKIDDRFSVGLSVLDLGFISWKSNLSSLKSEGKYSFTGIEMNNLSLDYDFSHLVDSIKTCFPLDTIPGDKYITRTNTKFLAEGHFDLNEHHRFTAAARLDMIHGKCYHYFAAGYTGNFMNWLEVAANTSIYRDNFRLGAAVGFNISELFQIYISSDNILALGIITAERANLTFGMLFNVGKYSPNTSPVQDFTPDF